MRITSQEDSPLLSAIGQRDKKAFDALFRKYYSVLCAYCHRFVDLEDAEEIVQDVLLWVWENPDAHTIIESSLNRYLFRMVYHRAISQIRQQGTRQRADTLFYEQMQEILQDIDFYHIEELTKRIEKAIAALPPSYREAFCMHRFQNMSYKEIATALDVSPKTVDYRIQQALKQLRVDLKDYLPLLLPLLYLN
ncbi:MAG: RNA polymerase sigma-70 factor [Bacteroides intestinalis]|nr:RNA polymerase sigma-70 factor [Bacteroides intestinalis]